MKKKNVSACVRTTKKKRAVSSAGVMGRGTGDEGTHPFHSVGFDDRVALTIDDQALSSGKTDS